MGGIIIRRSCLVIAVLVAVVLCLPLAASAQPVAKKASSSDHKYALLCGTEVFEYLLQWDIPPGLGEYPCIEDYGPIPAWDDVVVWRDLLINDYGWLPSHVTIQMNESNTKANIVSQITNLKQYDSPENLFLVVLVGHGWVKTDEGSLLPEDEWDGTPVKGVEAYKDGIALPDGNKIQRTSGVDHWDEVFEPYDGIPSGMGMPDGLVNFIVDDELKVLFDELAFEGKVVISFASCAGSGFCEDIQRSGMLALGVGNSDQLEMHWWPIHNYCAFALSCADKNYELPWYIRYDVSPDLNGDGRISLEEAYSWSIAAQQATDPSLIGWGGGTVGLYMFDGIQGETFL